MYLAEVFLIHQASSRFSGSRDAVTQALDLSVRSVDLVYLENGRHDGRFGGLTAYFVHCLHVAFPSPFLVSSKDPDPIWCGELHDETEGRSTTINSTIRVTLSSPSPIVIGSRTIPVALTHSPANPDSRVRAGVSTAPSIFSLPVGFVVGKGDRGTVLTANCCYVLCHVYVFSTSEPPGFADITPPATRSVICGNSTKDGVKNVLQLRNTHQITRSRVGARSVRSGGGSLSSPRPETLFRKYARLWQLVGNSRLFSKHETPPSNIFVSLGMLPGYPPQMGEGWWDVIGERPHEPPILDTFSEVLYESVV
ncbi:hypothetical protein TIFTF001_035884 [Ficus carica]|uniref:Uncharacterized protein n=1 Tax=Ficus carica TaxID=3494 RepID=A0AA88E365_FICCA|nr:hypothetical protein TIFTF001_035878 [Ficus carica]GMN66825.1 hypothetical protein TIFTF001_035884 [Ficus carica]